jgi:hypothetical protein
MTINTNIPNTHRVDQDQRSVPLHHNFGMHYPPGPPSCTQLSLNLRPISVEGKNCIIGSLHRGSPRRSFIDVVILPLPDAFLTACHSVFWDFVQHLQFLGGVLAIELHRDCTTSTCRHLIS